MLVKLGLSPDDISILTSNAERPTSIWIRYDIGYADRITLDVEFSSGLLERPTAQLGDSVGHYDVKVYSAEIVRRLTADELKARGNVYEYERITIGRPYVNPDKSD